MTVNGADAVDSMATAETDKTAVKEIYVPPGPRAHNRSFSQHGNSLQLYPGNDNGDFENMMTVSEASDDRPVASSSVKSEETFDMKYFKGRPSSCVFVASLSAAETDDHLCASITDHFKQWGVLVIVKVLRDTHNRPYAFVQYTNDAEASRAIREAQHTIVDGRPIRCEPAKVNRTLYISGPKNDPLPEKEVRSVLSEYGEIEQLISAQEIGSKCYSIPSNAWFCKFAYRDDAVRAYANLKTNLTWEVEWAQNIDSTSNRNQASAIDKYSIFVSQLDNQVTRDILFERFSRHGTIISINLVKRPSNVFAFIKFETEEATAAAVERENHSMLLTKTIHVQYKEVNHGAEKSQRSPLLQLAPPPVNLPGYKQSSNQQKVSPRNLEGLKRFIKNHNHFDSARRVNSRSSFHHHEHAEKELGSPFRKLSVSFKEPDEQSNTVRTDAINSGSPSPTTGTAASSIAERKSVYSATTQGEPDYPKDAASVSSPKQASCYFYYPNGGLPETQSMEPNFVPVHNTGGFYYPYYFQNGMPSAVQMGGKSTNFQYYTREFNPDGSSFSPPKR